MKKQPQPSCPVCNTTKHKFFTKSNFKETYRYAYCKNTKCKHLYINPLPTQTQLTTYYNTAYGVEPVQEKKARRKAKATLQILKDKNITPKSHPDVLEIGSSYGYGLDEFQQDGFNVNGTEISEKTVQACKKRFGIKTITQKDIIGLNLKKKFDIIVMFDVIEHMLDINKTLDFVNQHLKKDGVFIITTPNTHSLEFKLFGRLWEWVSPPAHVHLFNTKNIPLFMKKHSLRKIHLQSWKGDSAGNTLFHFFLTLRYIAAYAVFYTFPKSITQKLYNNATQNIRTQANKKQREFTGLMGILHSFSNVFEPLFRPLQRKLGPSLIAIYKKP